MTKKPNKAMRLRQHKPKKKISSDYLTELTGKDIIYWVSRVQRLIVKHSKPTSNPWHSATNTAKMLESLVVEVIKTFPKKGQPYDENMRAAASLGIILAVWYSRVQRAKCYDPRRPVKLRKAAYSRWLTWAMFLTSHIIDESRDQQLFPGQKWETPFDPYPTDGYFV